MQTMSTKELDSRLREEFQYLVVELNARIERTLLGPVTPNALTAFNLRKFRRKEQRICLAILSYYLDEGFGLLLRQDLLEDEYSTLEEFELLQGICHSKNDMLNYLGSFHEREIFGRWIPEVKLYSAKLQFLTLYPHRAKRTVRHRGYRDHGSCRPQSRWLPTNDWSLTEEQNQVDHEKDFRERVKTSIENFGLLGVRLSSLEGRTI